MGLFGKKKDASIRVMHYEGLKDFTQDFPCTVEVIDDVFTIKAIKQEKSVTLPMERILAFDVLGESDFMLKYHNAKIEPLKKNEIAKTYLVVRYITKENDEKYLAFWSVSYTDFKKLLELKNGKMNNDSYSL